MQKLYGRHKPIAPMNRTLFLDEEDAKRFTVKTLDGLKPFKNINDACGNIFCGDCLKGMKLLPPASVDMIFADPPYNIGKNFGKGGQCRLSPEKYAAWLDGWFTEAERVLKKEGVFYVCAGWRYSGLVQERLAKLFSVKNRITWRREKGRGSKRNWKNNMEDIWFAAKGDDYKFNLESVKVKKEIIAPYKENGKPKDWVDDKSGKYRFTHPSNIWLDTVVPFWSMHENTPHPTQKPEMILERLLMAHTDEGDIILDPFMGSGTTAAVAKRTGRKFTGFELNEDFVLLALKRLTERVNI